MFMKSIVGLNLRTLIVKSVVKIQLENILERSVNILEKVSLRKGNRLKQ